MILATLTDVVKSGAGEREACKVLGLSVRSVQRWRRAGGDGDDLRHGPASPPRNSLTPLERGAILAVINSPEYCDLSPKQVVPRLADKGRYLASESTMYRILRAENQLTHRGRAKRPERRPVKEHIATAPHQVWSWDITYLPSPVRGSFYYLYLVEDIWSRKIVGWEVHDQESVNLSARMITEIVETSGVDMTGIVLHADNGNPMRGSTMVATLQRLGVIASFSRPSVSNDNPFSESLFRTMKYCPEYPRRAFGTMEEARRWVARFVSWYNEEHRHSGIRFVTPSQRHTGQESTVLAQRTRLYEEERRRRPERWSRGTRNWEPVRTVYLNPQKRQEFPESRAA